MSQTLVRAGGSVQSPTFGIENLADLPSDIQVTPIQLTSEDGAPSRGLLYKRKNSTPKVGVHIMHPRSDVSTSYYNGALSKAGYAVLARGSRSPNNDVSTIHENVLLDLAAGVRFLKEQGCETVILLGASGGASLAAFYQAQASAEPGERLTETPAGDPLDLNKYDLPEIDGITIIAGHLGEGLCMEQMIDAAVIDEDDPLASDPDLDMYNPANGFAIPPTPSVYSQEFLARYRAAQKARVRRIDAKARSLVNRQREAAALVAKLGPEAPLDLIRQANTETHMIIYRTAADPAYVDLTIDPDDRPVHSYFSDRPDLENYGSEGFGRYLTPRAWLSTWSANTSNAKTAHNLAKVKVPTLFVHYAGDCGTRMSHAKAIIEAGGAADKTLHLVRHTGHFGMFLPDAPGTGRNWEGMDKIIEWLQARFPV
ncbi:alpha/beta hydrolase [Tsuneonella flava]|uniref:Alpha/beta hydrolase n=1 Tax=Tsuneonella flava TaxID=2055955 RepID=A0ABX7KEL0_9SPHN|nr:hypothetical protein [Tsuneonella flava]QSB45794.1 alpha/beta hydrolase [Tsuneonella flava]